MRNATLSAELAGDVDAATERRILNAAKRARKLEGELTDARADLRAALAESKEAGTSFAELARVLGVTRQRVKQLLR